MGRHHGAAWPEAMPGASEGQALGRLMLLVYKSSSHEPMGDTHDEPEGSAADWVAQSPRGEPGDRARWPRPWGALLRPLTCVWVGLPLGQQAPRPHEPGGRHTLGRDRCPGRACARKSSPLEAALSSTTSTRLPRRDGCSPLRSRRVGTDSRPIGRATQFFGEAGPGGAGIGVGTVTPGTSCISSTTVTRVTKCLVSPKQEVGRPTFSS